MHKTLVQTLLAAFCAILACAALEGGGVMPINMRNGMTGGGEKPLPVTEWVDGYYWSRTGVSTEQSGASRCDNFIPVQPSSTLTFYFGFRPGGKTLYMLEYNANKARVNAAANGNGVAKTITIPATCYYIRISCETARKENVYVHDDTNDTYLVQDGRVLVAEAT